VSLKDLLKELVEDWQARKDFYFHPFPATAQLTPAERGRLFTMDPGDLASVHPEVCDAYVDDDWRLDEPDAPPAPATWIEVTDPAICVERSTGQVAFAEREAWSGPAPEVRHVWPSTLPWQWNRPLTLCGEGLDYRGAVTLTKIKCPGDPAEVICLPVQYYVAENFRRIYLITKPLVCTEEDRGEYTVGVVNYGSQILIPALHTLRII
jgi:hypothetical protein